MLKPRADNKGTTAIEFALVLCLSDSEDLERIFNEVAQDIKLRLVG